MIIRPATVMDADELMGKALKVMNTGTLTIVIQKKGRYRGIVSDRALRTMQPQQNTKVETIAWKAPVINEDMPTEKVAELFSDGSRELPVVRDGAIVGVVRHVDLLKQLAEEGKIPAMKVNEIMSVPVLMTDINESIARVAGKMRNSDFHHIVVTENGKNMGMLSTADIQPFLQKVKAKAPMGKEKSGMSTISLRSAMLSAPALVRIKPNASVLEAARLMIDNGISAVLVDDGKQIGIIDVVDIIRTSLPSDEPQIEIIGLKGEELEFRDQIRSEASESLGKIQNIMPIEFARLTVKVHAKTGAKHQYSLHMMVSGKRTFEASASGWKLFTALHEVLKEAERMAIQEKEKLKGKKSRYGKMRSLSVRIREGELYPGRLERGA
ncbi:CBS domain protein [uncultured archaeon]|nr:CBS domain protein [uncultured archaeon]